MNIWHGIWSSGWDTWMFWIAAIGSLICICQTPSSIVTFAVIWGIVLLGWMIAPLHDPGLLFYAAVLISALYMLNTRKSEMLFGTGWAIFLVGWYLSRLEDPATRYVLNQKRAHIDTLDGWLDFALSWCAAHWLFLTFAIVTAVLVKCGLVIAQAYRKSLLIRAVAIELPMLASRTEKTEPEDRWKAGKTLMKEIGIDGIVAVQSAKGKSLNINRGEEAPFFAAAESVYKHKRAEDHSYINRRQGVRLLIDAFAALVGDVKSLDVAWTKTIDAMEFYWRKNAGVENEENRLEIVRLTNLAKLMGLPCDMSTDPYFLERLSAAKHRQYPPGVFSLWLATRMRNYRSVMKFGFMQRYRDGADVWMSFEGEQAFQQLLKYQVFMYDRLSREFPQTSGQ